MISKIDAEHEVREKKGDKPSLVRPAMIGFALGATFGVVAVTQGLPLYGLFACAVGGTVAGAVWGREKRAIYENNFKAEVSDLVREDS